MKKILILVSTYNGEKYIEQQLNSLLNQSNVEAHILIRDDGSTDHTCSIIEKYIQVNKNITLLKANNVGVCASFYALAREAYEKYTEFDYYAFADQDDVWLDNKLERAATALNQVTDDKCLLYASAFQMTDNKLQPIPTFMLPSYQTFGESLVIQPTIGCTMVFNGNTLRLFVKGDPNRMLMHDSWIYKMCLGCGGIYIYDSFPSILYRQHEMNVKGASQTFLQRWRQRWGNFWHNRRSRSIQAQYLLDTYEFDLTPENKIILSDFVNATHSIMKRIKVMFSTKYSTAKLSNNLLFRVAVLFNKV